MGIRRYIYIYAFYHYFYIIYCIYRPCQCIILTFLHLFLAMLWRILTVKVSNR